jgi:drug/metabolite transporter (DMT)-like permease
MNDALRVKAAIATMTLLWGTTWGAIRIGLDGMPPLTGISLRFFLAAVLLIPLAARLGQRYPHERAFWLLCLANGLLLFTVSYSVVYWCEQWVPSGLGAVIFATYPLFVMLLAHVALPSERMARRGILAGLVGFLGIAVVFSEDLRGLLGPEAAIGAVVLLISPLVSALAAVSVKRWGAGYPPLPLTVVSMLVGAFSTGVMAWFFEGAQAIDWNPRSIGALLYLAVFGSAVTFGLYFWLLTRFAARSMALIAYGTPVVAVVLGALLLHEPFTIRMALGAILVIAGVAWALREHR